jgi:sigma-B regulation protein RsbU (phosphoserine phosphatase)
MTRARPLVDALASVLVAFVAAIAFERGLIRVLGLDLLQLEWISDVVLALAFGVATFLWLHLRLARTALTRLERARLVIETELAIAADIQRGMLPRPPAARDGWRFAAQLEQAGPIGGDFYDFVDRGRSLLVLLADVSGKGIPAALVMESSRTLFGLLARETDRPEELVARLGRALFEEHGGTPYLTCVLARIDLDEGCMAWVNAGHPAALVVTGTEHRALASTGPPAGMLPDPHYDAQVLRLAAGDTFVLVTDGVTEAIEADDRVEERLAGAVARRRTSGPQAVCDGVMRLARSGRGPRGAGEWQDDRTVVAVTLDAT